MTGLGPRDWLRALVLRDRSRPKATGGLIPADDVSFALEGCTASARQPAELPAGTQIQLRDPRTSTTTSQPTHHDPSSATSPRSSPADATPNRPNATGHLPTPTTTSACAASAATADAIPHLPPPGA